MASKKVAKSKATRIKPGEPKTAHHKRSRDFVRVASRLARRLRQLREERGWTVNQAAEAYGVEPMTVWRLESGEANPTLATLVSVAVALGVPVSELLDAR